ncbi:hypothetical protein P154DRAFT_526579 [Amniculicola lignicola CBS 123094]|uniref:SUN domain-containing protein n=1 Tax=Amniculicola lignicola CBS 123094 TaxID=1392246 RepID=A0A6A5VZZ1_9PLEO|nr:hypothetical protein P154DRAFT_526579 [Amniculicola lignicola CBS 123094]
MPTIGAPLCRWTTLLLLCSLPAPVQPTNETVPSTGSLRPSTVAASSPATSSPPRPSVVVSSAESTCAFRTINYITHTLPQQCLRTTWAGPTPSASPAAKGEGLQVVVPWGPEHAGGSDPVAGQHAAQSAATAEPGAQDTPSPDAAAASGTPSTQADVEVETDSPLDNANFLSFEDWKNRNLAKAGQSPENVGQGRAPASGLGNRRRPANINALDSLGEESEIEIDFSGFGSPGEQDGKPASRAPSGTRSSIESTNAAEEAEGDNAAAPRSWELSKDAGKTCKERFNYASFDCAATVLKTNSKAKSSTSLLVENKDSYMLNECAAQNKFVIVELCDDILVDTVVLANYEFFSSMFRHFRVSVSDRYPVKMERWRTLATFEARNSRDIQAFLITEPQIWARYLRIEFLSHYGYEYYCPLSLLRVHGTTMMEQFRREEEEARGYEDYTEPLGDSEGAPVGTAANVVDEDAKYAEQTAAAVEKERRDAAYTPVNDEQANPSEEPSEVTKQVTDSGADTNTPQSKQSEASEGAAAGEPPNAGDVASGSANSSIQPASSTSQISGHSNDHSSMMTVSEPSKDSTLPHTAGSDSQPANSSTKTPSTAVASAPNDKSASRSAAEDGASSPPSSSSTKASSDSTANGAHAQSRSPSQIQPNPAAPTTQESFFKALHKRLQNLEANSTLSLQYIEEQSRILRDAFMKVEKRQLTKTEKFLDHLNSTVMQELKSYRNMYEQLWQSTILELEGMKERQRSEIGEIGTRLSLVADELVWQKRMAVVQSTLLLLCLGLVLFVRSGTLGSQPDMPIAQQLGNKYSRFFDTPPGSPQVSGGLRRRRTFRNMWRSDTEGANAVSDADTDGRRSPANITYSPPNPITPSAASDLGHETGSSPNHVNGTSSSPSGDGQRTPSEELDAELDNAEKRLRALETQSGPATPHGSRDTRPSWEEVDRTVDMMKADGQGQGQGAQLQVRRDRQRRKKRSPLRRGESYDGAVEDSPGADSVDATFNME